ncbi:hypothetical protein PS627_01738 [Pseudomonas fluorescens]|nr:hypothetical protein PS627_01738 [Pseudomonas fluorescens]
MLDGQLRQWLGEVRQRRGQRIGATERQLPDQEFVEHHTQRIQVGTAIDVHAARLLGAHVARRADRETGLGELGAVIQRLGDTEVRQHHSAIDAEQDVGRFHVTVHQPLGMGITQRLGDLPYIQQCLCRRQASGDALLERAAWQVLHGHVVQLADIADVVDGGDMRVRQPRQGAAFAQEALAEGGVGSQARGHDLQSHLALQRALGGQVDAGHGALAKLAVDVEAGDLHVQDAHHFAFTTTAVMLSGAPRVSPRCTRLRTTS